MLPWGISIYKSPSPYFKSPFGLHSFGPIKIGLSFYTWHPPRSNKDWHARRFLISPVNIKTQTKNSRKRNSPLNTCVGGIRLEGCMLYLICKIDWRLMHSTCIMHTCIAYRSCIILTPYFVAIIDSSGSSYVWGQKGGRLVRTDSSPKSIAKEILRKLEKSPINPLCLEAAPIPVEQTEGMEQQQGGNWTL